LGITENALSEIGHSVAEELNVSALALASKQRPIREMRIFNRRSRTSQACSYEDWAKHFGTALWPLFVRAFETYVKVVAETIVKHRSGERPLAWRPVFEQALQFCRAFEDLYRPWLGIAFGHVGSPGEQLSARECAAFLSSLSKWRTVWLPDQQKFSTLEQRAERIVNSIFRLAPGRTARNSSLTEREKKIWTVIARGVKGLQYCRELDSEGVRPPRTGVWRGAAGKYSAAFKMGAPWPHRIQDEKSKIRKKVTTTGFSSLPASE